MSNNNEADTIPMSPTIDVVLTKILEKFKKVFPLELIRNMHIRDDCNIVELENPETKKLYVLKYKTINKKLKDSGFFEYFLLKHDIKKNILFLESDPHFYENNIFDKYNIVKPLIVSDYYVLLERYQCNVVEFLRMVETNNENMIIIFKIFKNILKTVQYLHYENIIHNDIKASNILINYTSDTNLHNMNRLANYTNLKIDINNSDALNEISCPKLCDFETSTKLFKNDCVNHEALITTYLYSAPEVLYNTIYSKKSDIWSLGILLYWMIYRRHPYRQIPYEETLSLPDYFDIKCQKIFKDFKFDLKKSNELSSDGYAVILDYYVPINYNKKYDDINNFIKLMLQFNPINRPSINELIDHDLLKSI